MGGSLLIFAEKMDALRSGCRVQIPTLLPPQASCAALPSSLRHLEWPFTVFQGTLATAKQMDSGASLSPYPWQPP